MTLSISNIGQNSASYFIGGLDQNWNTINYSQACITLTPPPPTGGTGIANYNYIDGTFIQPPSSFGLDRFTQTATIPNRSPNTSYTVYAAVQKPDGKWYPYGSATFTTSSGGGGGTPTGSLNLSVNTGAFANTFSLGWSSVSGSGGSTTYEVWMKYSSDFSDSYFALNTTTTNTSILSLSVSEYRSYDFWLRSKNSSGYGSFEKIYGRYPASSSSGGGGTPSARPYWDSGDSSLSAFTNAHINPSGNVTADGSAIYHINFNGAYEYPTEYQIYANDNIGSGWVLKATPPTSISNTITIDKPNHTYSLKVTASNSYGSSTNYLQTEFTTPTWAGAKPSGWNWATEKIAGEDFDITAVEWNNFTDRINTFRAYYDTKHPSATIGQYSFTTAPYDDGKFYGWMYNQAVTAINEMSPPTPIPSDTASTKSAGMDILAKYFDDLRASLNSCV